jgi:hypothetical protein
MIVSVTSLLDCFKCGENGALVNAAIFPALDEPESSNFYFIAMTFDGKNKNYSNGVSVL